MLVNWRVLVLVVLFCSLDGFLCLGDFFHHALWRAAELWCLCGFLSEKFSLHNITR
jgi:hypothetical protein